MRLQAAVLSSPPRRLFFARIFTRFDSPTDWFD
jgi:hypothetical protein